MADIGLNTDNYLVSVVCKEVIAGPGTIQEMTVQAQKLIRSDPDDIASLMIMRPTHTFEQPPAVVVRLVAP